MPFCVRTPSYANSDESVSTLKDLEKSGNTSISTVVKAYLRALNASYCCSIYRNGFPLPVSSYNSLAIFAKYRIKYR